MKRILLALILLVMAAIAGASYAVRQSPAWMRAALEDALGKSVAIGSIDFQFPTTFVLSDVRIAEKDGPFAGEPEFTADTVRVTAMPTGLRSSRFVIDDVEVREALVVVRRSNGRLYHALSKPPAAASEPERAAASAAARPPRTLAVSMFRLHDSRFQFADFDAGERGFAFDLDGIDARVSGFQVPASGQKTSYAVQGRILQGRDEKPAEFGVNGATAFATLDGETRGELKNVHLPYFAPYVARVTPAVIEEGYLDLGLRAVIDAHVLSADAELRFTSLYFRTLERGGQLFGLSAAEILDFLKDSSGRLRIPLSIRWNFGDRSTRLRDVVRRSIETSLKGTVFGNVGAILEKAIVRIREKGLDAPEKASDTVLKKIKDFLKY